MIARKLREQAVVNRETVGIQSQTGIVNADTRSADVLRGQSEAAERNRIQELIKQEEDAYRAKSEEASDRHAVLSDKAQQDNP